MDRIHMIIYTCCIIAFIMSIVSYKILLRAFSDYLNGDEIERALKYMLMIVASFFSGFGFVSIVSLIVILIGGFQNGICK